MKRLLNKLNLQDVPYVLFANKQDISSRVIEHHTIKPETPIIPTIATSGQGVGEGLRLLIQMIRNEA